MKEDQMRDDGGPAYPGQPRGPEGEFVDALQPGMTLRDYAEIHFTAAWLVVLGEKSETSATEVHNNAQKWGKIQATAMLKARSK